MLERVGRLRHGDKCGYKQSDRRTPEDENEDSLHREKTGAPRPWYRCSRVGSTCCAVASQDTQ
jgi:hypothetical protein